MKCQGYLLDTNIVIAILANDQSVMDFVIQAKNDQLPLFFSVITECEVISGMKSKIEHRRIKMFNSQRCLGIDSIIAQKAGHLRREQITKSRKLKTPDALIIATALEHQLALVSRDSDMNFVTKEIGIPLFQP